jgi:hypothetical protein
MLFRLVSIVSIEQQVSFVGWCADGSCEGEKERGLTDDSTTHYVGRTQTVRRPYVDLLDYSQYLRSKYRQTVGRSERRTGPDLHTRLT